MGKIDLKVALEILEKWKCSKVEQSAILGLKSTTTLDGTYITDTLSKDQQARLNYVLRIQHTLEALFENPDNINGFMLMENHNSDFDGACPIDIISSGELDSLRNTCEKIESIVLR